MEFVVGVPDPPDGIIGGVNVMRNFSAFGAAVDGVLFVAAVLLSKRADSMTAGQYQSTNLESGR